MDVPTTCAGVQINKQIRAGFQIGFFKEKQRKFPFLVYLFRYSYFVILFVLVCAHSRTFLFLTLLALVNNFERREGLSETDVKKIREQSEQFSQVRCPQIVRRRSGVLLAQRVSE
eukprot:TRINITY_DN20114_c1_g1_i1.p3 TRINITY_DN20114_c1_g1~~TRINITY_DN20114_c1_g1_i1.p3  ORF type:complete len:115 (-),score=4.72 TRINITY_DN20114_c1_g1_i1:28-372(-)